MEEDRAANQRSAFSLSFTLALYISNGFGLSGWRRELRANVDSLDLSISFELKHDISNVEFGFITQLGMIWQQTRANFCSF